MTSKTAMHAAPRLLSVLMIAVYATLAPAVEISYDLKSAEPTEYRLISSSMLDFAQYAALASALGIKRIGQNAQMEFSFANQNRLDNNSGLVRGTIERVSIVNIFNDSLYLVDSPGWDIFRTGNSGEFSLTRKGKIKGIGSDPDPQAQNLLAFWAFVLPEFPSELDAKEVQWEREISLVVETSQSGKLPVTLKITYDYSENKNSKAKKGIFFEYLISGFSPVHAELRVSGSGGLVFDQARGRLMSNKCKLKITGFGGLGDFGLPAEWAGKIPLAIDTQIEITSKNENE